MQRRFSLVRTISTLGLAAVLAVPALAQQSGAADRKPPIRVKVVSPKDDAARHAPRIPVRLVLPGNATGPAVGQAGTGPVGGAVDIVIGDPATGRVVPSAATTGGGAAQPGDRTSPATGSSLFDQLVAPSWSGGGGFDRAPWPDEAASTEARVVRAPAPVAQQVAPPSRPPSGERVEPALDRRMQPAYEAPRQPVAIEISSGPSRSRGDGGPASSSGAGQTPPETGEDYLLGPGDRVDVFVWRNPDLSRQVPVRPDGRITLPLAGEVYAAGKTVEALRDEITARLGDFIQMPTVTVTIAEIRSLVVYVLGDVRTPGAVQMDRNLTVLQAIAAAGGLNEFADRNDIVVMRTNADGTARRWTFRYDDVVGGKRLETNIVLQAGDTIIVP